MDQFVYLKRHSTPTNLHRVKNDLFENVNDDAITGVCLLRIVERLDSINLIKKLEMHGITNTELKLFSSYPGGR